MPSVEQGTKMDKYSTHSPLMVNERDFQVMGRVEKRNHRLRPPPLLFYGRAFGGMGTTKQRKPLENQNRPTATFIQMLNDDPSDASRRGTVGLRLFPRGSAHERRCKAPRSNRNAQKNGRYRPAAGSPRGTRCSDRALRIVAASLVTIRWEDSSHP